jgi:hypothetical protein
MCGPASLLCGGSVIAYVQNLDIICLPTQSDVAAAGGRLWRPGRGIAAAFGPFSRGERAPLAPTLVEGPPQVLHIGVIVCHCAGGSSAPVPSAVQRPPAWRRVALIRTGFAGSGAAHAKRRAAQLRRPVGIIRQHRLLRLRQQPPGQINGTRRCAAAATYNSTASRFSPSALPRARTTRPTFTPSVLSALTSTNAMRSPPRDEPPQIIHPAPPAPAAPREGEG